MKFQDWKDQVLEWRLKYNVPDPRLKYDPTALKISCRKCNKLKAKMSRHHKASDYLFATLLSDIYAKRYLEFRKEDTDKLCDKCHKRWHAIIKPFMQEIYHELYMMGVEEKKVTQEQCEAWRKTILVRYEKWASKPIRGRSKKK